MVQRWQRDQRRTQVRYVILKDFCQGFLFVASMFNMYFMFNFKIPI